MPNGMTPIIPEIYYEVRTIYGRNRLSLNTNPYSYEILSTSVRHSLLAYLRTKLSMLVRYSLLAYLHTKLNHVTYLALIP